MTSHLVNLISNLAFVETVFDDTFFVDRVFDVVVEDLLPVATSLCGSFDNPAKYSGGSNSERSKSESIRKPYFKKFGFRMVKRLVWTIRKPNYG